MNLRLLLIPLLFLAFYMPLRLPLIGEWFVPNAPALLLGLLAMSSALPKIQRLGLWVGIVASYCLVNMLFAHTEVTAPIERIKSSFQLIYFVGLTIVIGNSGALVDQKVRKHFGYLLIALGVTMLIGAFFESGSALGVISDRFRSWLYAGGSLYMNDSRDMLISDSIRPKLFASEPSVAAMGTCVCLTMGALFSNTVPTLLMSAIGCLTAARAFGSPIPIAFIITILAGGLPTYFALKRRWTLSQLTLRQVGFILLAMASLAIAFFLFGTLRERVGLILAGEDRSTYLRLVHVGELAIQAMQMNFFFGVGMGGEVEMGNQLWVAGTVQLNSSSLINNPVWA
ncbi:MAG: hypothetical protein IT368_02365, partial [Candidatus Hydrogenedentes bacterium]|nr:hypothetical protein [Candidatus Hydrogenedentota bacterium]